LKFAQALNLIKTIDIVQKKTGLKEDVPVFMLGDFNSKPSNSSTQLICGRGLDYKLSEDLDDAVLITTKSKKSYKKRDEFIHQVQKELADYKFEPFSSAYEFYNESIRDEPVSEVDLEDTIQLFNEKNEYQLMEHYKEKGLDNLSENQKWALANYYKHPEFTNWSTAFAFTLDYIFYRASDKRVHLESITEMPTMEHINEGIKDSSI